MTFNQCKMSRLNALILIGAFLVLFHLRKMFSPKLIKNTDPPLKHNIIPNVVDDNKNARTKPPAEDTPLQKNNTVFTDYYSTGSKAHHEGLKLKGIGSISKHAFKSPCIIDPHVYSNDTILKPLGYRKKKIIACFNCPRSFYKKKNSNTYNVDFKACPYSECEFSQRTGMNNSADMVMFWEDPQVKEPPKRPPGQLWTYLSWEPPPNKQYPKPRSRWLSVFNYSISYTNDSDFILPYDSLVWRDESLLPPEQYYVDAAKWKTRTATWWVSNCGVKSGRIEYVNEMKKYIDIDIYGKCGNVTCSNSHRSRCWKELNTTYIFYLAFENSFCPDYVSEKFYKMFQHPYPIIPVVRGGFDYDKNFPPNTFINAAAFKSPKELALYLRQLSTDPVQLGEIYKEKLKLRNFHKRIDWCDFCEQMHTGRFTKEKVIHDIKDYVLRKGCWPPTDMNWR